MGFPGASRITPLRIRRLQLAEYEIADSTSSVFRSPRGSIYLRFSQRSVIGKLPIGPLPRGQRSPKLDLLVLTRRDKVIKWQMKLGRSLFMRRKPLPKNDEI